MRITILNTSEIHPINVPLKQWIEKNKLGHEIKLVRSKKNLSEGDLLFLISCSEIISKADRAKFKNTLVIHASDLPSGRGWSPHIWAIIHGASQITLSLLEAEDKVDSGKIWKKNEVEIPKTALYDEINELVFEAELELMSFAVENFGCIEPQEQSEGGTSFWPKRTPEDSEVSLQKSIGEQFDLIRVCDPDRFPAFFYTGGKKYTLKIEAVDE